MQPDKSESDAEREIRWIVELLDRAGVPVAAYHGQGHGVCDWTTAGRVEHLLALLRHAQIPLTRGTIEPVLPASALTGERD